MRYHLSFEVQLLSLMRCQRVCLRGWQYGAVNLQKLNQSKSFEIKFKWQFYSHILFLISAAVFFLVKKKVVLSEFSQFCRVSIAIRNALISLELFCHVYMYRFLQVLPAAEINMRFFISKSTACEFLIFATPLPNCCCLSSCLNCQWASALFLLLLSTTS